MRGLSGCRRLAVAGLTFAAILGAQNAPGREANATADRVVLSRSLPTMKGNDLTITVLEVSYAPGASSIGCPKAA